jgi:DNA ligase-1
MSFPHGFKPMLSATLKDITSAKKLKFPGYISPKIDGIRCIVNNEGVPITRNGKVIMNQFIAQEMKKLNLHLLDGELGLGDPTAPEFFNNTSALIRRHHDDNFDHLDFYVFDKVASGGYEERFVDQDIEIVDQGKIHVHKLLQRKVFDYEQLLGWEEYFFEQRYEGIMYRQNLEAEYKFGRASLRSGELIKFKRFEDDEAVVTGFVQMMRNANEATLDEWGHTVRSSHQENKIPVEMVGVILGQCQNFDGEIRVGTGEGITHDVRKDMWLNPHKYIGRTFTFSYQANSDYEKVRFGSFKGWREDGI